MSALSKSPPCLRRTPSRSPTSTLHPFLPRTPHSYPVLKARHPPPALHLLSTRTQPTTHGVRRKHLAISSRSRIIPAPTPTPIAQLISAGRRTALVAGLTAPPQVCRAVDFPRSGGRNRKLSKLRYWGNKDSSSTGILCIRSRQT